MNAEIAIPTAIPRRHDLDALRAFAMLLGIGLHGAMSFMAVPGFTQDSQQNGLFTVFFLVVHGFRMPLFFIISGFFTAMLWRRRGVKALMWHRFKRIFLPCLIGLFTIVPAVTLAAMIAKATASNPMTDAAPTADAGLIRAIRESDKAAVETAIASGAKVNSVEPSRGISPLAWAAMQGDVEVLQLLVENGAEVDVANRDGATALHAAAFLGRAEAVNMLLEAGADPQAKNAAGNTPWDSTMAGWQLTKMIAGALKIDPGSREELRNRRNECRQLLLPYLPEDQQTEARQTIANAAKREGEEGSGSASLRESYAAFLTSSIFKIPLGHDGGSFSLTMTPLFHHLWFLWFLCWLVPLFSIYAVVVDAVGWTGKHWLSKAFVAGPWRMLWLVPLTMIPQWFMGVFVPVFGPDTSVGLLPHPHVLLYYGVFFGFGALYFDTSDDQGQLGGWWWLLLPVAILIAFPAGAIATFTGAYGVGGLFQVIYAWAMSFGMIGLCRQLLTRENRTIRYVSDSSYWLYLAHMPLVILLQALVRDWPIWSFFKFSFICIVTSGLLLLTYRYFVRYTFIGWLLNGPRKRPQISVAEEKEPAPLIAEIVDRPAS